MQALADQAHAAGALLVVYADALSMAMFTPPGEYGADIVASEGQALGVPPTFGGPYVGIFACKQNYIRQMPGRIVGRTVDTQGRTAYVLTLQTREQHIRRERATSNICTSVALIALMTTVYMAANGKHGMRRTAELTYQKSHYLASLIDDIPGYSVVDSGVFFQEFAVRCPIPPSTLNERLLDYRIIGGLDISERMENGMLVCATEVNTREEIDSFAAALAAIPGTERISMTTLLERLSQDRRRLLMDRSVQGRVGATVPQSDVPEQSLPDDNMLRDSLDFPEISENDLVRYFSQLSQLNFSIDHNFYPLGSCTMKYNPKIDDEVAGMPGFAEIHPLQPAATVQGAIRLMWELQQRLVEITGMKGVFARAHGRR